MRWFFIIPSVFFFLGLLMVLCPAAIVSTAFDAGGVSVPWGLLIGTLFLYVGHRSTK